jgi:glycosyltransferase 2 family protein
MSGPGDTQAARPPRRSGWLDLVKVAVSAGLVYLILQRVSLQDLQAQLLRTRPSALILPFALIATSNLLGALQWGSLVRAAGVTSRGGRLLGLYLAGLFFNNFWIGNLGGDVYKVVALGRTAGGLGRVAGATVADRVIGAAALCVLALIAALDSLVHGHMPAEVSLLVLAGSVVVVAASGVLLHPVWGQRLEAALGRKPRGRLLDRCARLLGYLGEYRERAGMLRAVFLLSLVIQSARVLAHYCVALAMGWTLHAADLTRFFLVIPLLGLVVALPISINGWGAREWAGVALFAPLGRGAEESVALLALTAALAVVASLAGSLWFVVESWTWARGRAG